MIDLFTKVAQIEKICPHGWADVHKALTFAALTMTIRPTVCVEIGVFGGRSALPIAMALKEIGRGTLWCIDPWSQFASVQGQTEIHQKWWGELDHEVVYNDFLRAIRETGTEQCVNVLREKSDNVTPPQSIDFVHVDGNHSDQAIRDVDRFCSRVRMGGFVCADDLDWVGGGVLRAVAKLKAMGFVQLYTLGTGAMFQRGSLT